MSATCAEKHQLQREKLTKRETPDRSKRASWTGLPSLPRWLQLSRRCRREFTLYLSTRWDMTLERATFKAAVAPALKQMLDARGVSFGYMDPRSDLGVEDLKTPRGVDAVLVGTKFAMRACGACR